MTELSYAYLINATGPKLDFDRTPGLGPEHHSYSVCTVEHAVQTSRALDALVERMKAAAACATVRAWCS